MGCTWYKTRPGSSFPAIHTKQSFPKLGRRKKVRAAAQSVFTFGETKHQDGVWLTESWFGRTLQNKVCFHSALERLEEIGIQSCFSNEAASFLLPK